VKVLADTSVLVAAMVESHPDHERAFRWLRQARHGEIELAVCAHSLAETYSVLSTLPVRPRIGPETARRLVRDNVESVATIVELRGRDYLAVLDRMSSSGLAGGIVYDALAVRAAEKVEADRLVTLNAADFRRAWPDGVDRIIEP